LTPVPLSTVAQATPRPVAGASQELDHGCLDAPADVGVREVGPRFGNVVECLGDRDAGVVTVDHAWINIRRSAHRRGIAEIRGHGLDGRPDGALAAGTAGFCESTASATAASTDAFQVRKSLALKVPPACCLM